MLNITEHTEINQLPLYEVVEFMSQFPNAHIKGLGNNKIKIVIEDR